MKLKSCALTPLFVSILSLAMPVLTAQASDFAKEKRWAEQIVDSLMVGEAVWLPLAKGEKAEKFLGLYTESAMDTTKGAVIVVHGIGIHPNWADVVHPIRSHLPEMGWATLSIQMPVLKNEASVVDYVPLMASVPARFEAAIQFLQEKGINNINIVAHSLGTLMTSYYLSQAKSIATRRDAIKSYVGLSMVENDSFDVLSNVLALKHISVPVFDVFGSEDQKSVRRNAAARKEAAAAAGNTHYRQVKLAGADHFYHGKEKELLATIQDWLQGIH